MQEPTEKLYVAKIVRLILCMLCSVSFGINSCLHILRRFTNPADIPLGDGKNKIRALKARVRIVMSTSLSLLLPLSSSYPPQTSKHPSFNSCIYSSAQSLTNTHPYLGSLKPHTHTHTQTDPHGKNFFFLPSLQFTLQTCTTHTLLSLSTGGAGRHGGRCGGRDAKGTVRGGVRPPTTYHRCLWLWKQLVGTFCTYHVPSLTPASPRKIVESLVSFPT